MDSIIKLEDFYYSPLYKFFDVKYHMPNFLRKGYAETEEYKKLDARNKLNQLIIESLINPNIKLEIKCNECSKKRVFIPVFGRLHQENWRKSATVGFSKEGIIYNEFECSKETKHRLFFIFRLTNKGIIKIGQHPSFADFQESFNPEYISIIGNEKYLELNKSIGLSAHGIGIGSFVYLRRVFEFLLDKAHKVASTESEWDEGKFSKSRIKEKIEILREYLPNFIIENKNIYGILSKGIHELSESECLEFFPVLKSSIEIILDEELDNIRKKKKVNEITRSINRIENKIR